MVPMNHCFQSLTGSFFPFHSSFLFLSSSTFFFPHRFSFSFFSLLFFTCLFSPLRLVLSLSGSFLDLLWGKNCVFMAVETFHGVVPGVDFQPIPSPGERRFLFFVCNLKQTFSVCIFFSPKMEASLRF